MNPTSPEHAGSWLPSIDDPAVGLITLGIMVLGPALASIGLSLMDLVHSPRNANQEA